MPNALTRLIGGPPTGQASSGNALATAETSALQHSHPDVPTPSQPGNFHSLRTIGLQTSPRFYTKQEATSIKELASQRKKEVGYTRTAYKALSDIDNAETEVEGMHYDYLKTVASNEAKRLKAKTGLMRKLHSLRVVYDSLGQQIQSSQQLADHRIATNRQVFADRLAGQQQAITVQATQVKQTA